jgi:hypothetical protein
MHSDAGKVCLGALGRHGVANRRSGSATNSCHCAAAGGPRLMTSYDQRLTKDGAIRLVTYARPWAAVADAPLTIAMRQSTAVQTAWPMVQSARRCITWPLR